ncbi:LacI family DNA-binding transcriptional regulator [Companilactobacillus hulinensis]|uniref:LacI family DNA-binding transcriptional regulator n=1 Tax=Companilactobacillus hulinensis TaxID=2486007 RepID=UPI000F769D3F|nr:LacI family DNA-binding transcriptional regulator [Companilactobacillus hulinensis]
MNIRDIAKLSGYSSGTVSRVINNNDYVSEKARKTIKKIIKEYDYAPNDVARNLSNGKTCDIGVVLPHNKHPYYTQLVDGIMDEAFASGYRIVLLPSKFDSKTELKYLNRLRRKAYDSIIFTSHGLPLEKIYKYKQYGSIVCCQNPGEYDIAAAYTMRESSYIDALNWIKLHNFKKISILLSRDTTVSATAQKTFSAYEKVFNTAPKNELLNTNVTTFEDGYSAAKQFHANHQYPDVYFTNGDDIAAGVRQFYLDNSLEIPQLIGQENQLSGQILNIPTINHHFQQVGKLACRLAINNQTKQLPVESEFIFRQQKAIEN